jgi:hypothetical protein
MVESLMKSYEGKGLSRLVLRTTPEPREVMLVMDEFKRVMELLSSNFRIDPFRGSFRWLNTALVISSDEFVTFIIDPSKFCELKSISLKEIFVKVTGVEGDPQFVNSNSLFLGLY